MKHDRTPVFYEIFNAYGNATKTAQALGITKQAVSAWDKVPMKHLKQIIAETGIPLERLRPDLFR